MSQAGFKPTIQANKAFATDRASTGTGMWQITVRNLLTGGLENGYNF
jgi:hypothetical protein